MQEEIKILEKKLPDYLKPVWERPGPATDFQKMCKALGQALADSIDADLMKEYKKAQAAENIDKIIIKTN